MQPFTDQANIDTTQSEILTESYLKPQTENSTSYAHLHASLKQGPLSSKRTFYSHLTSI